MLVLDDKYNIGIHPLGTMNVYRKWHCIAMNQIVAEIFHFGLRWCTERLALFPSKVV